MPTQDYADIIAFATDFSGNDTTIVERVKEMAENPPVDDETIGFYSGDAASPRGRLFLATVSLLDEKEKLYSVEDKYTYEILHVWRDEGIIDVTALPPAAKAVFGPLFGEELSAEDVAPYRKLVWQQYAEATRELEQHITARSGRVLLSIDATDGDTMFFALVSLDIADRWRDKALSEDVGYRSGVRSPMWDRFWSHLDYSTRGLMIEEGQKGVPPGIPKRSNNIPFAK